MNGKKIVERRITWLSCNSYLIITPIGIAILPEDLSAYTLAPVDMNIFPQRRDINRGWSVEGKRYRSMERYAAADPGTFVFSRPIYNDLLTCPFQIEYGYFDKEGKLHIDIFPNKY